LPASGSDRVGLVSGFLFARPRAGAV